MHQLTSLGLFPMQQHVPVWSWPRSETRVGLSQSSLCCHTPTRSSGLQVQEKMGNSCHFFSVSYSRKVNSQDSELPRTIRLAKESTRVGVFPGKDRGRNEGP